MSNGYYPDFLPSFFPTSVFFFRQVFSGLRSDGILCKMSLNSVPVYLPHIRMQQKLQYNVLLFLRCSAETAKINPMVFSIHVVLRSVAEIERLVSVMQLLTRSNQGLIKAFEHWSWELRLVQGVSLKILSSEAKGNNKKRHEVFFPQNRSQCVLFFFFCFISLSLGSKNEF